MKPMSSYAPVCNIDICEGFCCEHISDVVRQGLSQFGLVLEPAVDGDGYRCLRHNKETKLCDDYANRPRYCKHFFCPSAIRGFMRLTLDRDFPRTNPPLGSATMIPPGE